VAIRAVRNQPLAHVALARLADTLDSAATACLAGDMDGEFVHGALNGFVGHQLRGQVRLSTRRRQGMFFTPPDKAIDLLRGVTLAGATFLDPCCGAGDLLLAVARRLPTAATLRETLRAWGKVLHGWEIDAHLAKMARARLVMLAASRLGRVEPQRHDLQQFFPHVRQADGMRQAIPAANKLVVLFNPPYAQVAAPQSLSWGTGKVSQAAIFTEDLLRRLPQGSEVRAILPEVLRCGTRYSLWRDAVERMASKAQVKPLGPFDRWTDIDVFQLTLRRGKGAHGRCKWQAAEPRQHVLGAFATVRVGSVVPHRTPLDAPVALPYLHVRNAPRFGAIEAATERSRHAAPSIDGPFVVIRRTSSPKDRQRLVWTLVKHVGPMRVENHLIVLKPNSNDLQGCDRIIQVLQSPAASATLNGGMRCRHLTVGAIRNLPEERS
jgi:hypothetical protein